MVVEASDEVGLAAAYAFAFQVFAMIGTPSGTKQIGIERVRLLSPSSDTIVQVGQPKLGEIRARPLQVEQCGLDVQSTPEAGQFSRSADHTMARHNDGQWVFAICRTDCAETRRIADRPRHLTITSSLPVGNREQLAPNPLLKCGPEKMNRQLKCRALASEVFRQLTLGLNEDRMMKIFARLLEPHALVPLVWPQHCEELRCVGDQRQWADG